MLQSVAVCLSSAFHFSPSRCWLSIWASRTHTHTDRQRDRETDRQTGKQTDRQTQRHTSTNGHSHCLWMRFVNEKVCVCECVCECDVSGVNGLCTCIFVFL